MLRRRTSRSLVTRAQRTIAAVLLLALIGVTATAQDSVRKLNNRYRIENDPVRKAKLLAKLGPLQMDDAHFALEKDDQPRALATLQGYRDEVRNTVAALDATGVSAQKRPAGFKDLQVELRVFLRNLDDLIFSLPVENRAPFEVVRADLDAVEMSLLVTMFPSADEKRTQK